MPPVPDPATAPVPQTTTEAPPDAGSSDTTQPNQPAPTDDQPQAVDVAGMDGEAYAAAVERLISEPPQPEPGKPAPTAAAPADPATDTPPANETLEQPADTPPPDGQAPPEEANVPDRIRMGGLSEKSRALTSAAVLLAKAEGIEIAEAFARLAPPPAPPVEEQAPAPAPESAEAIEERITKLKADRREAATGADTVRYDELLEEIEQATGELYLARASAEQAESEHVAAIKESKGKARTLYPAMSDPASPLAMKWREVHDRLQAADDPLVTGSIANAPLVITQMAARELGIAPAAPKASPSVPAKPPVNGSRPQVQPAPGSARSAAPSNANGQLAATIASVKSTESYEELRDKLFAAG